MTTDAIDKEGAGVYCLAFRVSIPAKSSRISEVVLYKVACLLGMIAHRLTYQSALTTSSSTDSQMSESIREANVKLFLNVDTELHPAGPSKMEI